MTRLTRKQEKAVFAKGRKPQSPSTKVPLRRAAAKKPGTPPPSSTVPKHWLTLEPPKLPKRQLRGVLLERTEKNGYQFTLGSFDYHVRKEGREWVLDQFDAEVLDVDAAHRHSESFASLAAAIDFAKDEDAPDAPRRPSTRSRHEPAGGRA